MNIFFANITATKRNDVGKCYVKMDDRKANDKQTTDQKSIERQGTDVDG